MEIKEKRCFDCKEVKPLAEFYRNKKRKDGVQSYCKICWKKYYEEHKNKIKEYKKKYFQNHKADYVKRSIKWQKANPEKWAESRKKTRDQNDSN